MTPEDLDTVVEIGSTLPLSDANRLADAANDGLHMLRMLRAESAGALQRACTTVLSIAIANSLEEISGVLRGSSHASRHLGARIDLVWTGPDVPGSVSRLTSAVVADLIDRASSEVFLVSYAMHSEPSLTAALKRAIKRDVIVHLLYERTEDNPKFSSWSVPFQGLKVRRLCWPMMNRPPGASMHAKALIIDRQTSLIGSANVTDKAILHNIEVGLLIRDRIIASEIVESIESLRLRGILHEFNV